MARLLPFLLVASLVVIAASVFAEKQEDSVAEITLNEAIADPATDPEAKRKRGKGKRGGKRRRGGKKGKAMKKRGGKGRTKKNTKRKNRKSKGSKRSKTKKAKKGKKSRGCTRVQNAQCGVNAVEALKFEGTVVDNFITQKKRALNFKGIVDKKKGKKANFANATYNMLDALGGNGNAPVCSMTALRMSRASAADATANYATLKNCTTTIESDCAIANGTIDEAALEACNKAMFDIKTKNAECIAAADAAAKCACFVDAAKLVADAKAGDCKSKGVAANKAMKAQKTKCTTAFAVCNKAEAAASALINICLGGDAGADSTTDGILLIGGYNNGTLTTTELYPASPGCLPPALPSGRHFHNAFLTTFDRVAICGGRNSSNIPITDCQVLNKQGWETDSRIPSLPHTRHRSTTVTLPGTGTFILGGQDTLNSSLLLRNGATSWVPGPILPGSGAAYSCSVVWGDTFFIIGGGPGDAYTQVRQYSEATGWAPEDTWPKLTQKRLAHGCSIVGDNLIIAGGFYIDTFLDSTEIISLSGKTIRRGGSLSLARGYFIMATIGSSPGTLYALGGYGGAIDIVTLDTVIRWDIASDSWINATNLANNNAGMGFIPINKNLICT